MKRTIASIIALAALITGCSTQQPVAKSTTAEFAFTTNGFSLNQPKDTKFKRLVLHFKDGSSVEVDGYESTANAAAISAIQSANDAQATISERRVDAFKEGLRMGIEGYTGRTIHPPSTTQQAPQVIQPFYTPTPNLPSGGVIPNLSITPRQEVP